MNLHEIINAYKIRILLYAERSKYLHLKLPGSFNQFANPALPNTLFNSILYLITMFANNLEKKLWLAEGCKQLRKMNGKTMESIEVVQKNLNVSFLSVVIGNPELLNPC